MESQTHVVLSPNSITHERFIEALGERSEAVEEIDGEACRRATMALFLSEWGTFLRSPDNDDLAMLADVYDCGDYRAETIGRGLDSADNLFVTILAGCTPAWFAEGFPPNSYEQGLPTRFCFIYSDEIPTGALPDFDFRPEAEASPKTLAEYFYEPLSRIAACRGFVSWSPEAGELLNAWKARDFTPRPTNPLLRGYCARRPLHVAKLATLVALARHPGNQTIVREDLQRAFEILFEAEPDMGKALTAAGGNVYQQRIETVANFVGSWYQAKKRAAPEWEVRQRLNQLVPPNMLRTILDEMIAQQMLRVVEGSEAPNRLIMPGVIKKS